MIIGKREEAISTDYYAVENLIQEQYGIKDYSFLADQESSNDSTHTFDLRQVDAEPDEWDTEQIQQFKNGEHPSFVTHALLEDLVRREVLEPGLYHVSVSW